MLTSKKYPVLGLAAALIFGMSESSALQADPKAQVPDAPSATRPAPSTFPSGTKPATKPQNRPDTAPEENDAAPDAASVPPPQVRTVTRSRQRDPNAEESGRDEFVISIGVNFVAVPVTVKDSDGHMVDGLLRRDFSVYEDGVLQTLKLFTSDPFPLSAALIIDKGMSDTAMRRVNQTLPALAGAFSQFDEVALYTYGNTVQKVSDFRLAGEEFSAALRRTRSSGRTGGIPVVSGPMAAGPTVNGRPIDPSTPHVRTPARESHVLNDAILKAAMDLSQREPARRRIIFVISDGIEDGSSSSYSETLKVLLTNEVAVYSIGVDSAAIPVYKKLAQVRLPRFADANLLPKYVSATGGEHFSEFTRDAIERTYARLTAGARNQYTLGYTTRTTAASNYRTIEVRVKRPGLKVHAKDGYYPLPPRPSASR